MAPSAWWIGGGIAAVAAAAGAGVWLMDPRSVRNNNPGNIIRSGIDWRGMAARQDDPRFITFESPKYGFRAMARVIQSYRERGLDTVAEIITRWAPPHENDTDAYIAAVAERMGVRPHEKLHLSPESPQLQALVRAIAIHETGYFAWNESELQAGIALA